MRFIYFFDKYIKPHLIKGKGLCHPAETGFVGEGLSCVRQHDVNFWLYTKGDSTISFDAGHFNFKDNDKQLKKIGIRNESVRAVFITHADVDHGGGIDKYGENIFPSADVYLGEKEEDYITGATHRIKRAGIKIKNCVEFRNGYHLLKDREIIHIGAIKVQGIHTPGHTKGHFCYLVDDKILISGDCLAVNKNGGYSFCDFFTQFPDRNKQSLQELKEFISDKNITYVCTGHSGYYNQCDTLFDHINESATGSRRCPFDETAPFNVFS